VFNNAALVTKDAAVTVGVFARSASASLGDGLTLVVGCSVDNGPWMPADCVPVPTAIRVRRAQ